MNQSLEIIELFEKLKNSDLCAFNKIYHLYSQKVLNFAFSFSISQEDAEEIVQDTFMKIWDKREFIDLGRSLNSFIFVIAKNLTLNRIKQCSIEKEHLKKYFKVQEKKFSTDVEERLNFKEVDFFINQIVEDLPAKRREIFKLNRYKGLTYKETAQFLNISTSTVEKQMAKALKAINEKFDVYYKLILTVLLFY